MSTHDIKAFERNSLFDLTGKVALVTGGGSGIGLMATQALAANGAKVYITGRTREKLDNVVNTYGGSSIPGTIVALPGDVGTKEGVEQIYKDFSAREKCLCILVNNAGVSSQHVEVESSGDAAAMKKQLFDSPDSNYDDWTGTFNTNVTSYFFMTAAFLPLLQKSTDTHQGWSSTVINITSISGLIKSSQKHFAYNASKAAARHLTRMSAAEVANSGLQVRINSIAPGVFPSEMTSDGSDAKQKSFIPKDKFEKQIPAGRPGKDEDMAQTVLFVAANQYLNGQDIAVDGGFTLAAGM